MAAPSPDTIGPTPGRWHDEITDKVEDELVSDGWNFLKTEGYPIPFVGIRDGVTLACCIQGSVLKDVYAEDLEGFDQVEKVRVDLSSATYVEGKSRNEIQHQETFHVLDEHASRLSDSGWRIVRAFRLKENGYLSSVLPDAYAFGENRIVAFETLERKTDTIRSKHERYGMFDAVLVAKFNMNNQLVGDEPVFRTYWDPVEAKNWVPEQTRLEVATDAS